MWVRGAIWTNPTDPVRAAAGVLAAGWTGSPGRGAAIAVRGPARTAFPPGGPRRQPARLLSPLVAECPTVPGVVPGRVTNTIVHT